MTVTVLKPTDPEVAAVDAYFATHAAATPFHSSNWLRFLDATYGLASFVVVAREGDAIRGGLPLVLCGNRFVGRTLVALPFAGTQPALCAASPEVESMLIDEATRLGQRLGVAAIELREDREKDWEHPCSSAYVNIRLPIGDIDELWKSRVDSKVRTKVRAAEKRGLSATWGGRESLPDFYLVYTDTMRRLGSPPHRFAFFEALFSYFPSGTTLLLVKDAEQTVAAAVVMQDANWIGFPWAASLSSARKKHPNNLLYWTLIQSAAEQGYAYLDLGRSPTESGTAHFKMQWGANLTPLYYYVVRTGNQPVVPRQANDPQMQLASSIWKRLPVGFVNRFGYQLARLLP